MTTLCSRKSPVSKSLASLTLPDAESAADEPHWVDVTREGRRIGLAARRYKGRQNNPPSVLDSRTAEMIGR